MRLSHACTRCTVAELAGLIIYILYFIVIWTPKCPSSLFYFVVIVFPSVTHVRFNLVGLFVCADIFVVSFSCPFFILDPSPSVSSHESSLVSS